MDIRQLKYFISVAEYLNFTKAAKHHYIAQTAMSQQIRVLEQQLGVDLFVRNNRSVQLTPAGTIFLREAKLIVAIAEEAIKKSRNAACGFVGNLKIGFLGPNEKRFLPEIIRTFRDKYPNINLTFTQGNMDMLHRDLERNLLDVAFTMAFSLDQNPGFAWKTLNSDPICVILHRDHPLASQVTINLSALAYEPFVAMDYQEYPGAVERMVKFCMDNGGFTPHIVSQQRNLETLLLLIEAGVGITLLPLFFETYVNPSLRFIKLDGASDFVHSAIAWRKDYNNPSIPLFLEMLAINVSEKGDYPHTGG